MSAQRGVPYGRYQSHASVVLFHITYASIMLTIKFWKQLVQRVLANVAWHTHLPPKAKVLLSFHSAPVSAARTFDRAIIQHM